ncbi:hypothetical protein BGW80DRAFT_581531 [Lactifluus volemus]|nr:hypothetical protein BGW80DRAFT_581531 [Lactifluus volemus]
MIIIAVAKSKAKRDCIIWCSHISQAEQAAQPCNKPKFDLLISSRRGSLVSPRFLTIVCPSVGRKYRLNVGGSGVASRM